MSLLQIFAGIAYLIDDLLEVLSIVGSSLILVIALIGRLRQRRIYIPEQIFMWSVGGFTFGVGGLVALNMTHEYHTDRIGMLFGMSQSAIGELLLLSLLVFAVSKLIEVRY